MADPCSFRQYDVTDNVYIMDVSFLIDQLILRLFFMSLDYISNTIYILVLFRNY